MSAETKAALEAAIQNHIDDDMPGFLVSAYTFTCHLATLEDDRSHYFYLAPDRQPYHATLGLMQVSIDDFTSTDDD